MSRRLYIEQTATQMLEAFDGGAWKLALEIWQRAELSSDEMLILWEFFPDPQHRAWLKQDNRIYIDEYLK